MPSVNPNPKPQLPKRVFNPFKFLVACLLLLSVAFWWGVLIIVCSPILIPLWVCSWFCEQYRNIHFKGWVLNIFIGQDQLVNAIHGGDLDIHVSSRVGFWSNIMHSQTARYMEIIIDWLFKVFSGQVNHCWNAIEYDEEHHSGWGA